MGSNTWATSKIVSLLVFFLPAERVSEPVADRFDGQYRCRIRISVAHVDGDRDGDGDGDRDGDSSARCSSLARLDRLCWIDRDDDPFLLPVSTIFVVDGDREPERLEQRATRLDVLGERRDAESTAGDRQEGQ